MKQRRVIPEAAGCPGSVIATALFLFEEFFGDDKLCYFRILLINN